MPVRVLVVDDSGFFRRRLSDMLAADPRLQVVGMAADGAEAVARVRELQPDVVTMDVQMPVMDGISAVRRIMAECPTPILMVSATTRDGARATLEALDAGALDFVPKQFDAFYGGREEAVRQFRDRVRHLGRRRWRLGAATPAPAPRPPAAPSPPARSAAARPRLPRERYRLVVIGTSTGGPVALQRVLCSLPGDFPLPLLLVQHMPAGFTGPFASRLDQICAVAVKEAEDGDLLAPGVALVAPGGRQTRVVRRGGELRVRVDDGEPQLRYRPCVDLAFRSAAEALADQVLALVLTGMGADGREGARLLKDRGSSVWIQDAASCVVYGMPGAVADAGLADRVLGLEEIGPHLAQGV